jgi:hypothetical protein
MIITTPSGSCPLGFDVTREMFDFVEGLWEPPTDAEMVPTTVYGPQASEVGIDATVNRALMSL